MINLPLVLHETAFCKFVLYKSVDHDVFYIVRKHVEDGSLHKKGDISDVVVFVSNEENSILKKYPEDFVYSQDEIHTLECVKGFEPILSGHYLGHSFYFLPELMTGTQTDEQSTFDFAKYMLYFDEIRRIELGRPYWDKMEAEITIREK